MIWLNARYAEGRKLSAPRHEAGGIMIKCFGYAASDPTAPLAPIRFERAEPGVRQFQIDILYCGVCYSDLHQARNEWHNTVYPCMPGHEIVGRVVKLGAEAAKFRIGDLVGVGDVRHRFVIDMSSARTELR